MSCIYLTITEGFEKLTAGYRALENDGLLYTLVALMVIDCITELMITVIEKSPSQNIGFRGVFKKVLIFCFVGIGQMVDLHIIQNESIIRTAVIFFYISNEGISILKNAALIGLPVPKKLKDILEQLKDNDKKEK
ncbi:phage holin family protein [Oceanobacillus jordanicus]|uniref:Phage holin family protein n=1 Tax=Oceanobacillus jordanicus TaxID=2867266 RepID=A0AAW5B1C2_9BACI|nr:phage holin family protein [Oceanobacillus jordanicus]MCG3417555.1 phage holin family protein [Oceanobacillus jordanicus]